MDVRLICVGGKQDGQQVPIAGAEFLIGRGEDCHLRPGSELVSQHHAVILVGEGFVAIRDLASTNGTYVNGERIKAERRLAAGERVRIGPLEFEVKLAAHGDGKKKPNNVRSAREAASRNVGAALFTAGDELDISDWIDEEQDTVVVDDQAAETRPPGAGSNAEPGLSRASAAGQEPKEQGPKTTPRTDEEPPGNSGRFAVPKKLPAESSTAAAADMLRDYFHRRR
jgi:pSer/pThr/pTyr-binding forkhead associated (FHA) protein